MAEGPVVHNYSRALAEVLQGKSAKFRFRLAKLKPLEPSLQGLTIDRVQAHGKQFRFRLSDARILLVHLLMWGSWRIYPMGASWDKPRDRARILIATDTHQVVGFSIPVAKILTQDRLEEDPRWGNLGPDPLRPDFSQDEFFRRMNAEGRRAIGEVLLDQQVMAGLGNILKNEVLFRAGIHPDRTVSELSDEERRRVLEHSIGLCRVWLEELETGRRKNWIQIYQRSKRPCPVCGESIQFFRQAGRVTFFCPKCQT